MKEIWKGLIYNKENFSKFYEISNYGQLRNSRTKHIVKLNTNHKNYKYYVATLGSRKNKKAFLIHRAVACTFIINPYNLPIINHKDGNKSNNNINNLEWCTNRDNIIHAMQNNLLKMNGTNNHQSKFTEKQIKEIRKIRSEQNISYRKIANMYNVSHITIMNICKNKTYQ